jgi:hypothetical protein
MSIDHGTDVPDTDVRESNPNGAGPRGLEGDLGISSERTGPEGSRPADRGVEGTGSHGSAPHATDGTFESTPAGSEVPREHTQEPAEGPGSGSPGPGAPEETERTSTEDPAEGPDDPEKDGEARSRASGVDRTVGEENSATVRKHTFDPTKNPGHSGG